MCFNTENSSPFLVTHQLTYAHTKQQPNVDCPSTWFHRGFFGDVGNPNAKYHKRNAFSALASQLGSQTKAERLVDTHSATRFLARGHMLPKGDMVFAPAKLATCSLVSNTNQVLATSTHSEINSRLMLPRCFNRSTTAIGQ